MNHLHLNKMFLAQNWFISREWKYSNCDWKLIGRNNGRRITARAIRLPCGLPSPALPLPGSMRRLDGHPPPRLLNWS